jgi:hypothetical protein
VIWLRTLDDYARMPQHWTNDRTGELSPELLGEMLNFGQVGSLASSGNRVGLSDQF